MATIDLNIFKLESYNEYNIEHKSCIVKLSNDEGAYKYLGDLFYMIDRIHERHKENNIDELYIAYLHDQVVGFVSISIFDSVPEIAIAILNEYRKENLGKLLLQEFTYYLQDNYGFDEIRLQINKNNVASIKNALFVGYEKDGQTSYSIKR